MTGVLLPLLLCVAVTAAQTLVNIPGLGSLRGTTTQSYFSNRTIYAFRGIPFAERPVRFMPPTKKSAWEGVLDATSYGRECPQIELVNTSVTGDLEDCLFLDIYSPKVSNDSKLAVLFFIHGGGFTTGSSQVAQPQFLLEHDILLVAPQYRLGPLGFLNLDSEEIRGNAAMYDQLMALQWVYDNIQYFGGDPEKITVAGISAGAASASLQYVSPLTQDMIKQVLILSGSAVAFWAVEENSVPASLDVARYVGCEGTNAEVVSCLQNVDALTIVEAYDRYQTAMRTQGRAGMRGGNPVVDGHFLTEMPMKTLSNPNFNGRPMIMSVVAHEGWFLEQFLYDLYLGGNNLTNDYEFLKYGIPDVLLSYADQEDTSCTIATAIKNEYFKPEEFGNYTLMKDGITDFLGSAYFKGPVRKMAELNNARGGTTYLTTFNYYAQAFDMNGVIAHGRDQAIVFPMEGFTYREEDLAIVRTLTGLYATFVATGTPTGVHWEPYTLENGKYLIINSTSTMSSPFEEQYTLAEQQGLYKH